MNTQTHASARKGTKTEGLTLANIVRQMTNAIGHYADGKSRSFEAGMRVGELAILAKPLLGHNNFIDWINANFTVTPQWVRSCMRAYKARELFRMRPDAYRVEDITTIEELAGMYRKLKAGVHDPFTDKVRSENKVTMADLRARIRYLESKLDAAGISY